jgi:enoyl-CoA hydratase/carnithine racemase
VEQHRETDADADAVHRREQRLVEADEPIHEAREARRPVAGRRCHLPEILELAAKIAAQPLGSLRWTKRMLLAVRKDGIAAARAREDAGFAVRVGSPENVEALKAFLEKRAPDFRGVSSADRR